MSPILRDLRSDPVSLCKSASAPPRFSGQLSWELFYPLAGPQGLGGPTRGSCLPHAEATSVPTLGWSSVDRSTSRGTTTHEHLPSPSTHHTPESASAPIQGITQVSLTNPMDSKHGAKSLGWGSKSELLRHYQARWRQAVQGAGEWANACKGSRQTGCRGLSKCMGSRVNRDMLSLRPSAGGYGCGCRGIRAAGQAVECVWMSSRVSPPGADGTQHCRGVLQSRDREAPGRAGGIASQEIGLH